MTNDKVFGLHITQCEGIMSKSASIDKMSNVEADRLAAEIVEHIEETLEELTGKLVFKSDRSEHEYAEVIEACRAAVIANLDDFGLIARTRG